MTKVGYTELQAERLMHKIDVQAAKVCDELTALHGLVTDHGYDAAYIHEEVHTRARQLQDIVRRRKRRRFDHDEHN